MPEGLDFDTFSSAWSDVTGEDAGTPVVPAVTPTTDSGTPADTPEGTGTETAQGPQDTAGDEFAHWQQIIDGDPALAAKAKALQGDYTRKMQEMAEQRQQYAGWAALQQMAQTDPAGAAALLQQYAAQLSGGVQTTPQPEADPFTQAQWVSDGERLLAERLQAQEAKNAQFEAYLQQQQQQAEAARIQSEYQQVVKIAGRELSEAERLQLAGHHISGGFKSLTAAYRDLNFDAEVQRAIQRGRDEASAIVQQKAAAPGAPSSMVNRAPTAPAAPSSYAEAFEQAWEEATAG